MTRELSRLTRVDLRDVWKTEAQHFTPWLASEDNLSLLGDVLGIELELEAVEQNVGPFRADILCKDSFTENWVLIENQLERTDHTHLGQLITYAAGLEAVTIVWIAARIADEHRAAIDWLNDKTERNMRFFALEVELWRIGGSPAAPKFNIVSKPNDWSRNTAAGKRSVEDSPLTATRVLQRDYWTDVQALVANAKGPLNPLTPPPQSWLVHGIGRTGALLGMSMNIRAGWIRTEVYLTGQYAKSDYRQLAEQKSELETALGQALSWQELPGKKDCRISLDRACDPSDKNDWPNQHKWLVEHATRLHDVFRPVIARLTREVDREEDEQKLNPTN